MPRKSTKKNIRPAKTKVSEKSYITKIESEITNNQSKLSMVLGILIVLVMGILVFNYFNKSKPSLGPASQTQQVAQKNQDVTPQTLPGKYTIKDGDTLFLIAQKYYNDGDKFTDIAKANNISDVDSITVGQTIQLPKLPDQTLTSPTPSTSPSATPEVTPSASPEVSPTQTPQPSTEATPEPSQQPVLGTGGGNTTIWGPRIEGDSYTVQEGDWLSTIAGRAYGDIYAYQKIAQANNITDPNYIVPGMVLKIPR